MVDAYMDYIVHIQIFKLSGFVQNIHCTKQCHLINDYFVTEVVNFAREVKK